MGGLFYVQDGTELNRTSGRPMDRLWMGVCYLWVLIAKVSFFSAMANEVEPFLTRFQTSKPLSPFLYEACDSLLRDLLKRIVKLDIDAMTTSQLIDIDLENPEKLRVAKKLNWALQLNGS